jgi:hypothetical protein
LVAIAKLVTIGKLVNFWEVDLPKVDNLQKSLQYDPVRTVWALVMVWMVWMVRELAAVWVLTGHLPE